MGAIGAVGEPYRLLKPRALIASCIIHSLPTYTSEGPLQLTL